MDAAHQLAHLMELTNGVHFRRLDDNAKKLKIIDSFNRTFHHDFLEAQL